MTLTDFLLARIAEDETEANVMLRQYREGGDVASRRWRRVLAECEAKRRIVEEHREQAGGGCDVCSRHEYPCATLRALALPYADQTWRP